MKYMKSLYFSSAAVFFSFSSFAEPAQTVTHTAKDAALTFCQSNYDSAGKSYFGQPGEKFTSWKSCLDKKLVEFSGKSEYAPTNIDTTYAKQYCTRSFISNGSVYYGGMAEAEQPGKNNANAFSSYESCLSAKTKEHFYGSSPWNQALPATTSVEERAEAICSQSKEEHCKEHKIQELRKYDANIAARKEWLRQNGDKIVENKYEECARNNSDCGGIMPVRVGKLKVDANLFEKRIILNEACGLKINYFRAHFYGPNKVRLPDGRILDYGDFDNTIEQDYLYTLYSLKKGKDAIQCPKDGYSWYPETLTRQENIDLAKQTSGS